MEGLRQLVSLLTLTGQLAAAVQYCNEMLLLARTSGRAPDELRAINDLAQLHLELGDIRRGIEYAKVAELHSCTPEHASNKAKALLLQAQGLRRMGLFPDASRKADLALVAADSIGDVRSASVIRNVQGLISTDLGRRDDALRCFRTAVTLKTSINDQDGIAMSLNNIGLVHLDSGQLSLAQAFFQRAASVARERAHSLLALLSTINLAEIARLQGAADTCISLSEEALALAEASGRNQFLPNVFLNYGRINLFRARFSKALESIERGLSAATASRSHVDLCLLHAAKARILLELGSLKEAHDELALSVDIATRLDCPPAAGPILDVYAESGYSVRDSSLARRYWHLADEHSIESCGEAVTAARVMRVQGLLNQGDLDGALLVLIELRSAALEHHRLPDVIWTSIQCGVVYQQRGMLPAALDLLEHAESEAARNNMDVFRPRLLFHIARVQASLRDWTGFNATKQLGIEIVDRIARDLPSAATRQSFMALDYNRYLLSAPDDEGVCPQTPIVIHSGDTSLPPNHVPSLHYSQIIRHRLDIARVEAGVNRAVVYLFTGPDTGIGIGSNCIKPAEIGVLCRQYFEVDGGCVSTSSRTGAPSCVSARWSPSDNCLIEPIALRGHTIGLLYFEIDGGGLANIYRDAAFRCTKQIANVVEQAQARFTEMVIPSNELQPIVRCDVIPLLVGESSAMGTLLKMVASVIKADCNVLLVGESGTGKELVARSIHTEGQRKKGNFVPVDCGAVPESLVESELFGYRRGAFSGADSDRKGLLEEADGGTLFLDEITNTSLGFQAKLLRMLQSGEFRRLGDNVLRRVDARIIAATNSDIETAIREGRFREDLYYRLNVVTLKLPPLREREGDIPLLAEFFARRFCEVRGIPFRGIGRGALVRLQAYPWPGNVRELEHAVHAALVISGDGMVRREALPERVLGDSLNEVGDLLEAAVATSIGEGSENGHDGDFSIRSSARDAAMVPDDAAHTGSSPDEKAIVEDALRRAGGDKSAAARLLGWNRMRLYRSLRRHGIPYDTGREQR